MPTRMMIAAALILLSAAAARAEPVREDDLGEVYESCVTAAVDPSVNAAQRMRYCYCVRDEVQRRYTRESLAALRERVAANTVNDEDHALRERMFETCRPSLQEGR